MNKVHTGDKKVKKNIGKSLVLTLSNTTVALGISFVCSNSTVSVLYMSNAVYRVARTSIHTNIAVPTNFDISFEKKWSCFLKFSNCLRNYDKRT